MKLTLEDRLRIAKLHVIDDVPITQLAKDFGADTGGIKYFVSLYKRWGEKAFKKDQQRVTYTRELKLETIHEVLTTNISYRQKAVELMLTDPTILRDWVRMYKKHGEAGIKDTYSREAYKRHDEKVLEKEYKKLLEDLERTKAENEYLKKSFPQVLERSRRLNKKH